MTRISIPPVVSISRGLILAMVVFLPGNLALLLTTEARAENREFSIAKGDHQLQVSLGLQVVARYVFRDEAIPRPYLCDVTTADGTPVTRNNPPREGVDRMDHPTFHPGIWMAFGELGGADFWRDQSPCSAYGFGRRVRVRFQTHGLHGSQSLRSEKWPGV